MFLDLDTSLEYGTMQSLQGLFKDTTVSTVEGVTFGIHNNQSFHTIKKEWPKEEQIRWALANMFFFTKLGQSLLEFATQVSKEVLEENQTKKQAEGLTRET